MAISSPRQDPPVGTERIQRYVWQSQWGEMLIEVVGDQVLVDGKVVEPFVGA